MKRGKLFLLAMIIAVGGFTACKKGDAPTTDNTVNEIVDESTDQVDENTNQTDENKEQGNDINNTDMQESTVEELPVIIEKIYEIKDTGISVGDVSVDLNDSDAVKYYTGLSDVSKIKEVAISEAMIGSQAYSLVLVRLNQSKDAETVANEMLQGINPRKWICVEADDLQGAAQGDVVMLIMESSELESSVTSQNIVDAFQEVRGADLDLLLDK